MAWAEVIFSTMRLLAFDFLALTIAKRLGYVNKKGRGGEEGPLFLTLWEGRDLEEEWRYKRFEYLERGT